MRNLTRKVIRVTEKKNDAVSMLGNTYHAKRKKSIDILRRILCIDNK